MDLSNLRGLISESANFLQKCCSIFEKIAMADKCTTSLVDKMHQQKGLAGVSEMKLKKRVDLRASRTFTRYRTETCLSTRRAHRYFIVLFVAGMMLSAAPADAANFVVRTEADLRNALHPTTGAQNGDSITLANSITLTSNLPNVQKNITIEGAGFTLSGGNQARGLTVISGDVGINNLNIVNAKAKGGNGGDGNNNAGGGGGGGGFGGALFVAAGARVTVNNVSLNQNSAQGGKGGSSQGVGGTSGGGGGGGIFGNGGNGSNGANPGSGGAGLPAGGAGGGSGQHGKSGGFGSGGGGGASDYNGGNGGFGAGGGGGGSRDWGSGGADGQGGAGGWAGGRGASARTYVRRWIGDDRTRHGTPGGGGAGMGGAVFVQEGGTLILAGKLNIGGNQVVGGAAGDWRSGERGDNAAAGQAIATGLFLQGNGTLTFAPGTAETQTISDEIIDQKGHDKNSTGSWSLVKNGDGTTILTGVNKYTGGNTVNAGTLQGNTISLSGAILNRANVTFDQATDGTYDGAISGTGSLTKIGAATLILGGLNTYSGGTIVSAGTLQGTLRTLQGDILNNATVVVNDNNNGTYKGNISGTGKLVKSSTGDVTLAGNNTYTGGTTVNGGTLRFTSLSNLGGAAGPLVLNNGFLGTTANAAAGLVVNRDMSIIGHAGLDIPKHPLTWSGVISGPGKLVKRGDGELALESANTHAGGTRVDKGTLKVSHDNNLGAHGTQLQIDNNAVLRAGPDGGGGTQMETSREILVTGAGGIFLIDNNFTLALNGAVNGNGNLTKTGTGTLILNGHNSYSGGTTTVQEGILQGTTLGLQRNIVNNARLVFDQPTDGTYSGNISGRGSLTKNGTGTAIFTGTHSYTGGTTVNAGALQGNSNNLTGDILNNAKVVFDQTADGNYNGAMTGLGSLVKKGAGKLNLTGSNVVGGGTTLEAGGLAINGDLTSNVLVKGGILSGKHNITGNVTLKGGEIAPGNSIGKLTINGELLLEGGNLEVDVNGHGGGDHLKVIGANGKATISDNFLEIIATPGPYTPGLPYTFLSAEQGVVGTFSRIVSDFAFLTPSLSYGTNDVSLLLTLAPNAFAAGGRTANQRAVGHSLDAIAATGSVDGIVSALAGLGKAQGAAALDAVSGQPYANFGTLSLRSGQLFLNAVGQQVALGRNATSGGAFAANGGSAMQAHACAEPCGVAVPEPFRTWISPLGASSNVSDGGHTGTVRHTIGGVAMGIDRKLSPDILVGIATGYLSGNQRVDGFSGRGSADIYTTALYGSLTQGRFYADAMAGYAYADQRLERTMIIGGLPQGAALGTSHANQFMGQIEVGHTFALGAPGNISITPFARLNAARVDQVGFTETGLNTFRLQVQQQGITSVSTALGADLKGSYNVGSARPLDLKLRLGWIHAFADTARPFTAGFANWAGLPGNNFTVYGAKPPRDSALVGLSANTAITDTASLYLSYDAELGNGLNNHALLAGLRMEW